MIVVSKLSRLISMLALVVCISAGAWGGAARAQAPVISDTPVPAAQSMDYLLAPATRSG